MRETDGFVTHEPLDDLTFNRKPFNMVFYEFCLPLIKLDTFSPHLLSWSTLIVV